MSSPSEDPKITYYSIVLAIELKNGDGNKFSSLYDTYTKDLSLEEVQRLKELVRNYEKLPVQTLQHRVKWLSGMNKQDTVDADNQTSPPESFMSNDHPSDDATITLSIAGKAKSTPPQARSNKSSSSWANKSYDNVPFMDEDSDTGLASENRYISSYGGGTGDFVASSKGGVAATNSGVEERKRESYLRKRGDPVAISIGDGISYDNQTIVSEDSNDWETLLTGDGFLQSKNSSGDESGDSRSGASTRSKENKKLRKKKRKQTRSLNGEADFNNADTESKDGKLAAGLSAAAQRNRRRKKWNENHNKTAAEQEEEREQCIASAPVLTASVGTTASERPKKKRSVKSFKEEKAREQNFSSQLTTLQYFKELPISVNIKQENTLKKKKQEEEKRKEEIKEFLSEERMIEIIKSIEDVSGDKKKPKESKVVAPPKQKGKKNKKNKKTAAVDQGKKNQLNENKSAGSSVVGNGETEKSLNNMDGEVVVGGKVESSISDNEDGDKDFVIQRRSRKTNASKNNNPASGRTSPSALQGKRGKRRFSDPSPKTDEMQTKSPTGSSHQSATCSHRGNAAVATTSNHCASSTVENMRAKAADLSNENNWPKLEAAFMPSTSNHDGISAVQTGSNHQSVASYASKLKANLDSIGCSPASSGEDGNSSTSSGGGLSNVNQYSNCTTSPNEFEPSPSFSNHSSNQSELVSFAENHLKYSAAAASKKDVESSSSTVVVTSFCASTSSKNRREQENSSSSNVGALDQPTGHRSSEDLAPATAKSAGGKTINKKSCDVAATTSAKSNGDRSVKKTEKITASGQTATTEITFTARVENSAVANKKSAVEAKTATIDKKRESTSKSEVTKTAATLKKGNDNVVKKVAPPKQQVATLPRKANSKSKSSTDEKKKASVAPPLAFHDTDADVRTILENNDWKFSFFYNDPSMPDPIDISSCLNSKKESAEKPPTVSSKSPQAASSAAADEKLVAPKGDEQKEVSSSAVTEKTASSESSSVLPAPIVLTKPKRSQRLLNGTTVTSPWNDPGQFNVLAAQKFFLKRFKELSKTAVCYSRNHSD